MVASTFEIKLIDIHWISDLDEATDLCAHGHVLVKIGNEVVSDKNGLDITVSATALNLMRTLKRDYKKDDFAGQLLPCCGHFMVAEDNFVNIFGCQSGIDWTIIHLDENFVQHISETGQEALITKEAYVNTVLRFVDAVENFYSRSLSKLLPTDESDKNGYLTFWKEWKGLRDEWR